MYRTIFILTIFYLFPASSLSAQCIGRDSLWKKIASLRSSSVSPGDQLQVLLKSEENINRCADKNDSSHAYLLQRIASLYFLQADYLKAIQYGKQAIYILTANVRKAFINPRHLVWHYYFLSRYYGAFNMTVEKMRAVDSCVAIGIRLKAINLYCLSALYERVEYFFDIGDYHQCLNYADECERLAMEYARSGSDKEYKEGKSYAYSSSTWKVNSLFKLKNYDDAETLLKNQIEENRHSHLKSSLGTIYEQLAEIQVNKGNYAEAVSYFNKALTSDAKFGFGMGCKTILNNLGHSLYFKRFNDFDKSLATYQKALTYINKDVSQNTADAFESLNVLSNIALVFVKKGLYDSAFKYFQLAYDQIKPGTNESEILHSSLDDFIKTKKIYYLIGLCIDKGDAFKQQYYHKRQVHSLQEAIRIYRQTDKLLERIRTEESEMQSKLFWRNDTRRLYENAIEACYEAGNMAEAFYFFERSRAVLLNDELNQRSVLGSKEIAQLVQVKKKIQQLERDLKNTGISNDVQKFQNDLFERKRERDQLSNLVGANNPYYFSSFLDSTNLSLQQAKEDILRDHQALIEMFVGDSTVYLMTITRNDTRIKKIDKSIYDKLVDQYISYISDPVLMNSQFNLFVKNSSELYHLIFQNNFLPSGRIIISPDGRYFPFEALVTSKANQPLNYFLYDHPVSYTYSARFLRTKFTSTTDKSLYNFMGMAPVNFPASFNLSTLKGSDQSASSLQSYFSRADNFSQAQASKKNFIENFSKYKIIQLYTHASDSSAYNEPVIFFSDSALYLSDLITENNFVTRLIVLSACETGIGVLYKGEGVFSFNRAFASLGIPSCINNLWAVDNESTYRLTELFYKYLAKGLPIDVSLQKAKIEFIHTASKEKQLPNYWAGTILTGKTNAIEFKKPGSPKLAILFSFIVVFSAWFLWQLRKKKPKNYFYRESISS